MSDPVLTAFEILLEEIEQVSDGLNRNGGKAFEEGRLDEVKALLAEAESHAAFQLKVRSLRQEWLAAHPQAVTTEKASISKRDLGRLNRGLRTPDEAYRRPLLEALMEAGGSLSTQEATDRVGQKMKSVLNEYDHEPLPSDPAMLRWRNTVAWMRQTLVEEGLMVRGSKRGVWEISEAGRKALTDSM